MPENIRNLKKNTSDSGKEYPTMPIIVAELDDGRKMVIAQKRDGGVEILRQTLRDNDILASGSRMEVASEDISKRFEDIHIVYVFEE